MLLRQLDYKNILNCNVFTGKYHSEPINLTNVKMFSLQLDLNNSSDDLEMYAYVKYSLNGSKFSKIESTQVKLTKDNDCFIWEFPDRTVKYLQFCCEVVSGSSIVDVVFCSFGEEA